MQHSFTIIEIETFTHKWKAILVHSQFALYFLLFH